MDDDAPLDDIPPESFNLQLRKAFGPAFVQARGVVLRRTTTIRARPSARGRATAFSISAAGYRFAEHFELQAYVRNVLDKAYLITPDARATLAPGISATFTGFVRF